MKSFSDCLKKHGLDKFERSLLKTRRDALLEGKEAADGYQAAVMAVNAYESDLLDRREAIYKAIGMEAPAVETKAEAPATPEPKVAKKKPAEPKPKEKAEEPTPEELAAKEAKAARRRARAKEKRVAALGQGVVNGRYLKRMFQRLGIDIKERSDIAGEKGGGANKTGAMVGTFRADGWTLDNWGQKLVEDGWLLPESQSEVGNENIRASMQDVRDFMRRVFDGQPMFKIEDNAPFDALAESVDDELTPLEVADLVDSGLSLDDNAEAFDAVAFLAEAGLTPEQEEAILERASIQSDDRSFEQAVRDGAAEASRGSEARPGGAAEEAFGLESQTNAEVVAAEEKRAAEEAQAAKEREKQAQAEKDARIAKEIASRQEASAENFTLGQSAEDALAGQESLLAPKPYEQPARLPGESYREYEAKGWVVDAMNGKITVDALIDKLRGTDLPTGVRLAITERLGDRMSAEQQRKLIAPKPVTPQITQAAAWKTLYYVREQDGKFRIASNKNLNPFSPAFDTEAEAEKWVAEFYASRPAAFDDLSKIAAGAENLTAAGAPQRVAITARINEIGRLMLEGKVGLARIKIGQLIELKQAANDRVAEKRSAPRQRGSLWINERLLRALRTGDISREQARLALWLLGKNPEIANDLAISIRSKFAKGTAGQYNPFTRVATLVAGRGDDTTAVHEILHHTERLMPPSVQAGIREAWARDLTDFESWAQGMNRPELGEVVADVLRFQTGDEAAGKRLREKLLSGELPESFYRLTSPSEYWAEHASELVSARAGAKGWVAKARQWLREFIEAIKAIFGLPSTAAIIRGLDAVLGSTGEYKSNAMLGQITAGALARSQQGVYESLNIPIFSMATDGPMGAIKQAVLDRFVFDGKSMSWINKTINTQFHKAETNRYYRPVYQGVQRYIADVNAMANDAADAAGENILPRMRDLSDVWFNPLKFSNWQKERQLQRDMTTVGQVVWAATLADIRPDENQLRNGFTATVRDTNGNDIGDIQAPPLNDAQLAHYERIRAALDLSLDQGAASEMVKMVREAQIDRAVPMLATDANGRGVDVMDEARKNAKDDPQAAARILTEALTQRLQTIEEMRTARTLTPAEADKFKAMTETMIGGVADKDALVRDLKDKGYAPLMRFGQYTVKVMVPETRIDGGIDENVLYFGMFESKKDANKMGREMLAELQAEHSQAVLVPGTMDTEAWKQMRGLSLDTLESFAKITGIDKDEAVQNYLKMAIASRSAMKRLIHRKGIKGYDEDIQRVLATFVTSQARLASRNYHFGDLIVATKSIPKEMGETVAEASKLTGYVQNPVEEAQGIRGFLFTQFLGGSIASALTNITQPILTTLPYLSQFEPGTGLSGAIKAPSAAAAALAKALSVVAKRSTPSDRLREALDIAAIEGVTQPQEIHQLYAESIRSGLGGRNLQVRKALRLWSSMFSLAESFNRNITFIAAFELADRPGALQAINAKRSAQGRDTFKSSYEFAAHAVNETQFVYNKGNRPNWARGGFGATIFTFKQFSIAYVEFLSRLPAREKAIALAILVMAAGAEGLPFEDDLVDLWDTIWQALGYSSNAKKSIRKWATQTLGEAGGGFLTGGVSGLPGSPIDVSGRLGVGNLIPGTALFTRSTTDATREVAQAVGPLGSVLMSARQALSAAEEGQYRSATYNIVPKAIRDAMQATDMYQTGYYRDLKGKRTIDTTGVDAAFKFIGLMPYDVSQESKHRQDIQQDIALHNVVEASIADRWARGIFDNDPDAVQSAIKDLFAWNLRNPEAPIQINPQQIRQRVQAAMMPAEIRLMRQTPREIRAQEFGR